MKKNAWKTYTCQHCHCESEVSFWKEVYSMHLFGKWVFVRCPYCGRRSWQRIYKVEKDKAE